MSKSGGREGAEQGVRRRWWIAGGVNIFSRPGKCLHNEWLRRVCSARLLAICATIARKLVPAACPAYGKRPGRVELVLTSEQLCARVLLSRFDVWGHASARLPAEVA